MKYSLGIVGSEYYNLNTREHDYNRVVVSQEVLDWLDNHDLRIDHKGRKVYICNDVEYIFLGLHIDTTEL